MKIVQRYRIFLALVFVNALLVMVKPEVGFASVENSLDNMNVIFMTLPPIFILLGLLDIWVPRETMIKLMGDNSGLKGIMVAFLLGSVAAGPLYAAFPIAGILLKKGCRIANILIFVGAWSTTKIPLILFEASSMGWKFMIARLIIDLPIIILIAHITERMTSDQEKAFIYENAAKCN